jgi:glucan 1,3-beta-glucosidase
MIKRFLAYGFMLAALFGFWYAIGRPGRVPEPGLAPGQRLQSVSYAPFDKDQNPLKSGPDGPDISADRIDRDLAILAQRFEGIRTYSTLGMEALPALAEKHGLKIMLGAWVGADPAATRRELDNVIEIARRHRSCVQAVVVGNESLLRREVTGARLAAYIREVKSALPGIPVTYADVWEFWLKHPEVAPAVDFVTIHILPYWEDEPVAIDDAMAHVRKIREEIAARIPDREIVIGETGWPSRGRMRAGALPSLVNQARFVRGFVALAERDRWAYNLIEAFDQPWKRANEGAVGGYWGLYDADRRDKSALSGPVSNFPGWPTLFWLSAGIVLLTVPLTGRGADLNTFRWLGFTVLASLGTVLIVLQGHQFAFISHGPGAIVWAVLVMSQAVLAYPLLLSAAAGRALPAPLALAATMDLLRRPLATTGFRDPAVLVSLHRLAVITLALVAVVGLVFAPRYRSFNNWGFLLAAMTCAWLSRPAGSRPAVFAGLERFVAMALTVGAAVILIQETPLNWQANAWVGICLLLAWPLWRLGCGAALRPMLASGLGLLAAYGIFMVLRYVLLDWNRLAVPCMDDPSGLYCRIRDALGFLMYHQAFGWLSLVLSALAVWRARTGLCFLALTASLCGFMFYNTGIAAVAFVAAGLTLARTKLDADGPRCPSEERRDDESL